MMWAGMLAAYPGLDEEVLLLALVTVVVGGLGSFGGTVAGALVVGFALTLSNPTTIFAFIAVFGTLGARLAGGSPWTMIAGVLAGSALWWL